MWAVIAALTLCVAPVSAQDAIIHGDEEEPGDTQAQYTKWQDEFPGDQNSLGYGAIPPQSAMDHALAMPSVIVGVNNMMSHGYVREPNADYASSRQGYAVVVLGFRKPGIDIMVEEPILVVATKAYEVPNVGWRPATQVSGGVIVDSSGVWVPRAEGSDLPVFICGTPTTTTELGSLIAGEFGVPLPAQGASLGGNQQEQLPDYSNVSCWSEIVAIGINNRVCGAFTWYESQSPGTKVAWQGTIRAGYMGALTGAYSGGRSSGGNPIAMAGGAAFGATMGTTLYWASRPDTTRRAP